LTVKTPLNLHFRCKNSAAISISPEINFNSFIDKSITQIVNYFARTKCHKYVTSNLHQMLSKTNASIRSKRTPAPSPLNSTQLFRLKSI